jgi:hypothetical protein
MIALLQDCASAPQNFWQTERNKARAGHVISSTQLPRALQKSAPRGAPWFTVEWRIECPQKNHDALLSFSVRWRSALSRLLPLLHSLAQCMPSRWLGRSPALTSSGACPRCARGSRNPKPKSMIHCPPCIWDKDASPQSCCVPHGRSRQTCTGASPRR